MLLVVNALTYLLETIKGCGAGVRFQHVPLECVHGGLSQLRGGISIEELGKRLRLREQRGTRLQIGIARWRRILIDR